MQIGDIENKSKNPCMVIFLAFTLHHQMINVTKNNKTTKHSMCCFMRLMPSG
jgi:hypothetical protein